MTPFARAHATTLARCAVPRTAPVGFDGLLSHSSFGRVAVVCGPYAASPSTTMGVARASRAPTSYVGYATAGIPTTSSGPSPSRVGSQATSSLLPTVGSTPSGETSGTPRRRANHAATASRRSDVPQVWGYPGASAAAANAAWTSGGVGSTGVPTERSTMPSGWAAAVALYGASVSQGKSGSSVASDRLTRRVLGVAAPR